MKKISLQKVVSILMACLGFLIAGCTLEQASMQTTVEDNQQIQGDIYGYIKSLGFSTEGAFEEDGMIIVEGDIGLKIADLKSEMIKSGFGTKQYADDFLVRQSKIYNISIRTTSNVPASWSAAINTAINDWTGIANCNIRFYRTTSTSADITISHNSTTATYVARASFANGSGDPGPTININPVYDNYNAAKMRWVMVHEIGHCIGMRHINNSESGRVYIPGTPVTDSASVMHPYVQTWSGFSTGDLNAAQYLYPTDGRYVIVYENTSYTGRRWIIHEGDNESSASRFLLNDKISSIRCYRGARVQLYQNTNYSGTVKTINNSTSNLGSISFNDVTSSVKWLSPYPQRVYLDFNNAYLIYVPSSNVLQITAEGNVLHYGSDWERVQVKPYLYHLRNKTWSNYYWMVNTSSKQIYRKTGSNFGSIGDPSDGVVANISVTVVGGEGGTVPTRFLLNFNNSSLAYYPASKLVRIYASNYLISEGNDWSKCNIGNSIFHIKQNVWQNFYWKINTTAPYFYRIRNGVFCSPLNTGTSQALSAGIRIIR